MRSLPGACPKPDGPGPDLEKQQDEFFARVSPRGDNLRSARATDLTPYLGTGFIIAMMNVLTIGQLARRAGVNVETVRYYERRALLPEPPRTRAGYRQYSPDAVRRIGFIKQAQELGFTLREIADLLALRVDPETNCEAVEAQAVHAITRIDAKVAELGRMRAALRKLVKACDARRSTDDCPIIEALEPQGEL